MTFLSVSLSEKTLGKVVNSASNFEISIGETANLIKEIMGVDILISTDESRMRPHNSEVNRLFGDNSMLRNLTNWKPAFGGIDGFRNGLSRTIQWFQNPDNLNQYAINKYMI